MVVELKCEGFNMRRNAESEYYKRIMVVDYVQIKPLLSLN